ncbi:MASE3 domain-containing protein [Acetohalobium arabaticum]|uniref:MASE3 domain-containing protein n=1 Tax=Acetohalobium arabaticum TaxID=28187 RepID=UPI00247AD56A|nr:MASE3 domain-containing protein [Acetohalobium arabaticum]
MSFKNFLLFHVSIELFSIIIAFNIFVIAVNASEITENSNFIFLGLTYGFVGFFDLLHTLAYPGMDILAKGGIDLSAQLWIIARYIESFSLLGFVLFWYKDFKKSNKVIYIYILVTAILLLNIFYLHTFPACFIERIGLTSFKIISEYIVSGILLIGIILLVTNKQKLNSKIYWFMLGGLGTTIGSTISLTFYTNPYDFSIIVGHLLKLISFYFIYKAITKTSLQKPYQSLFYELNKTKKKLEQKQNKLLNVAKVLFVIVNTEGKVTSINQYGCEVLGYQEEEIIGKDWCDNFVAIEDKKRSREIGKKLVAENLESVECIENNIITKEEEKRTIAWRNTILRDEVGNIKEVLGAGIDITDRKKLQEQLVRSEKLAELGKLASGICHEFNNQLAGMMGQIDILLLKNKQDKISLTADAIDRLKQIKSNGQQAKKIAYDLMNISKPKSESISAHDIKEIIDEILSIQQRKLEVENIEVIRKYSSVPKVKMNSDELKQIFLNLIINARDAMGPYNGGQLKISVQEVDNDEIEVEVSDTGIGMDEETKNQIFKPFFTTKADLIQDKFDQKGNGLGLSITAKIIEKYNGSIEVKSEKGTGTTFTIRIPTVNLST